MGLEAAAEVQAPEESLGHARGQVGKAAVVGMAVRQVQSPVPAPSLAPEVKSQHNLQDAGQILPQPCAQPTLAPDVFRINTKCCCEACRAPLNL